MKTQAGASSEARTLQTNELRVEFADGKKSEGSKLERAETLSAGSIEWTDAAAQSGTPGGPAKSEAARTKLHADKLEMEFGAEGKAKKLIATGNVSTERAVGGNPVQTATAQSGTAQLPASGGWSQMDLQGNVRLQEGDRSGQAEHATLVRATQTALLAGKKLARGAASEAASPRNTLVQATGENLAAGGARSAEVSATRSGAQHAPRPAR